MDISDTLAPKSDQLDAVDLLGSPPRIFTVESVSRGSAEQPVEVHLAEFPRVWRPGKSMRRVLAHLWGSDASKWTGRRVELFCDTEVVFGGEKVGGTRISRMSHIDGPKSVPIIIKKGRSGGYKVDPLPDVAPDPTPADLAAQVATALGDATTEAEVREWANRAHSRNLLDLTPVGAPGTLRELVQNRLAELTAEQPASDA